uniref:Uncharacterized protein n=1 Tax=Globisporangium ultimum (strain ATCC 200006 / CBS 805.95 / DAOM BR144) TaxID=431595 RepID=K3WHL9_GLOUD
MNSPTDSSDNDDDHHVFLDSVRFQAHGDDPNDQNGNASEEEDDSAQWTQLVFQRPCEAMVHVELFASGGYDHLLVLNLQQNAIQDLSPLLCVAPTLRVLNVAQNAIAQLPSLVAFWKRFQHLTLCFLEGNCIRNWKDMDGLQACSATLLWLTLEGNPIMSLTNARPFVINKLPFLKALDSFVVTDHELMKESALSPSMDVSQLRMPLEFADNDTALLYLSTCESEITRLHARNSPSIVIQRNVRGFLSRRLQFPRLTHICALVTMVQKRIRGFLFRRMLEKEFHELVCTRGQQQYFLPFGGEPNESLLLFPCTARRGLKALIAYVQAWKRGFYIKKQAIAIKKIRFWCQMAYQRYKYKSRLLLQDEHQVCIYYTPCLEPVLLAAAEKAAHRDPFLMAMAPADRTQFLKQRCLPISGVRVLRVPQATTIRAGGNPPSVRRGRCIRRDGIGTLNAATVGDKGGPDAVVRIFPSDISHENHLLISEKQLLHQDMERIANLKRQHQLAVNQTDTSSVEQDNEKRQQPRAVVVHLTHLYLELEKRLVICNKKILYACIKLQDWKTRPRPRFSLSRVHIKPRGHPLMRWEKNKIKALEAKQQQLRTNDRQYPKMHALIPWSIDMYLQILSLLDRHKFSTPLSSFILSYEQMRKVHAAVAIQCAWRAFVRQSKRLCVEVAIQRARVCIQRWWRFRVGLRRRMDFLRACMLLGSSITSRTLFMEEHVYRLLSDAASWGLVNAAMRPCREHHLHCRMAEGGHVQIALTPGQVKLRDASVRGRCCLLHHHQGSFHLREADAVSTQRCGAYFPVWLPGAPEHHEVSMSSRDEDATSLLLLERVNVEPTLLERELMVGGAGGGGNTIGDSQHHANHHPYEGFRMRDQVADTSSQVMALARQLFSHPAKKAWQVQSTVLALEATSFVRLTFESMEEAQRRALVLLAKTYDPVTRSYARLYSIEALFGAVLRHHQSRVPKRTTKC